MGWRCRHVEHRNGAFVIDLVGNDWTQDAKQVKAKHQVNGVLRGLWCGLKLCFRDPNIADDGATLLRQTCLVESRSVKPIESSSHLQDAADRDDPSTANSSHADRGIVFGNNAHWLHQRDRQRRDDVSLLLSWDDLNE